MIIPSLVVVRFSIGKQYNYNKFVEQEIITIYA